MAVNKSATVFRDETFLLTGATGGIGAALAKKLLADGANLVLQARSEDRLADLQRSLQCASQAVEFVAGDLTCEQDLQHIVAFAKEHHVTGLVNMAGINEFGQFDHSSIEQMVQLNVVATMRLTQLLLPLFRSADHGTIVNVGSTFGAIGFPGYVTYSATKHAIAGFSEALKRELSDTRVRIIYVSPRATATAMNSADVVRMNTELGVRTDRPDVVASAIVCSMVKHRERFQLGLLERLQSVLNKVLPSLVDSAVARQLPVMKKYLAN